MFYVEWISGVMLGKVHMASNRLRTLCGKRIPGHATESEKVPRDKTRICKRCRDVEEYELRHRHVFEK